VGCEKAEVSASILCAFEYNGDKIDGDEVKNGDEIKEEAS